MNISNFPENLMVENGDINLFNQQLRMQSRSSKKIPRINTPRDSLAKKV